MVEKMLKIENRIEEKFNEQKEEIEKLKREIEN